MTKDVRLFITSAVVLLLFATITHASMVHFRMDVSNSAILVGEQSVLSIYAYAQGVPADEGIIAWGLDLLLDSAEDGIVEFVSASFLHTYDVAAASFPDTPYSGMVNLGTYELDASHQPSQLGVGATNDPYLASNYTLLAQVTVEGIGEGMVTYDVGGSFYCELQSELDPAEQFRNDFSDVQITVIPEPATVALLAIAAVAFRRRNLAK